MSDGDDDRRIPKWAIYAVGAYVLAWQLGYVTPPDVPGYWPAIAAAAGGAAVVGWVVGPKIADLLPDEMGTLIIDYEKDVSGGKIYELNDPAFEELETKRGRLYSWPEASHEVYECRDFRPERLVAVANWKGTKNGSDLSTPVARSDIMREIQQLRESLQQEARYGNALRRRISPVIRTLEKKRAKSLNAALEGHISPELSGATLDEMIIETMPNEALPDHMLEDYDDGPDPAEPDPGAVEILDDAEAIDPVGEPLGPEQRVLNDGGSNVQK